jgi:hypothetical protein
MVDILLPFVIWYFRNGKLIRVKTNDSLYTVLL